MNMGYTECYGHSSGLIREVMVNVKGQGHCAMTKGMNRQGPH